MRPPKSFVGQPIRALQTMLRVIGLKPPLIPDGIYGPDTMAAVSEFQRGRGLPVTGLADELTWNAIVLAYRQAKTDAIRAQPLYIPLNAGQPLKRGDSSPQLYLIQGILAALTVGYPNIPKPELTGILDEATAEALSVFQALSGLPVTGELDKITWKNLAQQYPLSVNLVN